MFSIFKSDPAKKLNKQYTDKMQKAMEAQRNGDIRLYSELSEEAEQLLAQIDLLESK